MSSISTSALSQATIAANILVIARDASSANVASFGLNGYGIPFTTLVVPQDGADLPALESASGGNFGGIVVASGISYEYDSGWASGLTTDQWNQLYAYQLEYGVRMVQYDVYPGSDYGTQIISGSDGCCDTGVEQDISFTDVSDFPTAGLKTGAGVSTEGLWHYSSTILNTSNTKEIASFAANSVVTTDTTAAVINDFDGREQMVFHMSLDPTWSSTSAYLQHAWITWMTRGLHAGWRRTYLNTQIDDMMLTTNLYEPSGSTFRITTDDMEAVLDWIPTINAKMNDGSSYWPEVGFNGNGNIDFSSNFDDGWGICSGGGVYPSAAATTAAEWQKPLGTGTDKWPTTPTTYDWTTDCTSRDALLVWWQANLDSFGQLSHTFTHEAQDNATYADIYKEISFNQAWLKQVGIDQAEHFTANGIIPPAITGLHNGDALQAWWDNGITNCVGDNTRSALLNAENPMWPYWTVTATDGFDGMQVNPRWSTRIYYDCCTPSCTLDEWINTSDGSGTFDDLLEAEQDDTMRHLFDLYHEPYMFHQANLRNSDTDPITVNGVSGQYSLFQAWVEIVVQEFVRLVDWPLVTIKHADMSAGFNARYIRDACGYAVSYTTANQKITGVTVSATGNTCSEPIPVTFPVAPTNTQGFTTEQLGSDPLTVWVELTGSPVSFTLSTPIAL
ncbi:uncharacterized protein N7483_005047 [Penicillium malachiteum]|uniref:uncharacterized protein n=1 Tax=Penicillium malachiteum TaxID=1324776 RepID=UPI002547B3F0|nr:uncharacterized protein N7483_005047 [Penicillium malachiteum]KAJ5730539.1 hypothetical protein N7483_005047 [Penicillium malachiteum]